MGANNVDVAPRGSEVQTMVDREGVEQMRQLARRGWGTKRISKALHVTRNTVPAHSQGHACGPGQPTNGSAHSASVAPTKIITSIIASRSRSPRTSEFQAAFMNAEHNTAT